MTSESVRLPIPPAETADLAAFKRFVRSLRAGTSAASRSVPRRLNGTLRAAALVLRDLRAQGWDVTLGAREIIVLPPLQGDDPHLEKQRIRAQELIKADEQLAQPSVERFLRRMEQPVVFDAVPVSIRSLVRDGNELADKLLVLQQASGSYSAFREIVRPVIEIVTPDARCDVTGLRLLDIWRYFRHTWSSQHNSVPGRTMQILVRDAARRERPVIGIAALSSAVVQIEERDRWIGWEPDLVLSSMAQRPTLRDARWIERRLRTGVEDIFIDDFLELGVLRRRDLDRPSTSVLEGLRTIARDGRRDHYRFAHQNELKRADDQSDKWLRRARSDLFTSRRAGLLADLLAARLALRPYFPEGPTARGLRAALAAPECQRALRWIIRRAKSERVGTMIADLTVCGALDPYRSLTAGKLIAMLAVSPEVLNAFVDRYRGSSSEIASSIAGRSVVRDSRIAFVGTTSLYGSASSQYNRLRMPAARLGGEAQFDLEYKRLGLSKSYGTSHFREETVEELSALASRNQSGVRVNSVFGEGVNPKMRKIRLGIDSLGWPHTPLLKHGRQRLVYGVALVDNLRDFLLGIDSKPDYLIDLEHPEPTDAVTAWWYERWASMRMKQSGTLDAMRIHSAGRQGAHGALHWQPR